MFMIDRAIWYCFFLIAMGKMLVHDTIPYTDSDRPERVYRKKLVYEGMFLILSCFLMALISERAPLLFRLICAGVTAYNYHKLICLGCRKRTMSRYANLLTLILVMFTVDVIFLLVGTLIVGLMVLMYRVRQEYLASAAKWNPASAAYTADRQPNRAAYSHAEGAKEEFKEWRSSPEEEEADDMWQEEEEDYYFSSWDDTEDDSSGWGCADDPNTMDYASTDWSSYDYSSNPEVAATVLDMLF